MEEGACSLAGTEVRLCSVDDPCAGEHVHWADGLAVGTPTNLGGISWKMKKFWDDWAGENWDKVDGKFACSFSSQGGSGGGAELANMAMNVVLMNFGFLCFGITDYVAPSHTLHYGACVAKKPRNWTDQAACRRLGLRLAEWVAVFIDGRKDLHPLKTTKLQDKVAASAAEEARLANKSIVMAAAAKRVHLVVTILVPLANQTAWKSLVEEMTTETRQEHGCIYYSFASVAGASETFQVVELWETQAALDAHSTSAHFTRIVPAMGKLASTQSVVNSSPVMTVPLANGPLEVSDSTVQLTVPFDVPEEHQDTWLELTHDMMTATHREKGCLYYHFSRVKDSPTQYNVVELWATQADLDHHSTSPHFRRIVPRLGQLSQPSSPVHSTPLLPPHCVQRLLVFHKTAAYYHESIPAAVACIMVLARKHRWTVVATDDATVFSARSGALAQYSAIVFVSNSGQLFSEDEKKGLVDYVTQGRGGVVGVHAAVAAFLNLVDESGVAKAKGTWPFFGDLMGAYFTSHPAPQLGKICVDMDKARKIGLTSLPAEYTQHDEWFVTV